jgi:hypothetical protein
LNNWKNNCSIPRPYFKGEAIRMRFKLNIVTVKPHFFVGQKASVVVFNPVVKNVSKL